VLRELVLETPPNVGGGVHDVLLAWKSARRFKALDMAARRNVLDLFTMSAGDWLERWFESEPLKACFGFDAIVGNFATPYAQGTAYLLLHMVFGEVNGRKGVWGHAIGGMGAITTAMAAEATARGVEIRTAQPVARVLIDARGNANGVRLEDGNELHAKAVVANVNPRLLLTTMIAAEQKSRVALERFESYQCESATLRMNVALSGAPRLQVPSWHARSRIIRRGSSSGRRCNTWSAPTPTRAPTAGRRADRRDPDPVDARYDAGAARASTSRASSASTSATSCRSASTGTTCESAPPTARSTPSIASRRTSAARSSRGRSTRRSTSSASSASPAATSITASSR
jgi:hypothetical protein